MTWERSMQQRRGFVSMPISDNLASNGSFRKEKKDFYNSIHQAFYDLGIEIESAALNEDWGRIKLHPVEFTAYDLQAIERCNFLVVVTSERLTRDIYLEIGLALAWGMPVLFYIPASTRVTFMIEGLAEMDRVSIMKFDAEADVPDLIKATIPRLLGHQPEEG